VTYTDENIEDWDFRSYRSPMLEGGMDLSDPMVTFLSTHWSQVLVTDYIRLTMLNTLLDQGQATLTPDGDVMLTSFGEQVLPHMTRPRDVLTEEGRRNRRTVKSLVREWKKYGRLPYTILPADLSESFPGLFDTDDPNDPYAAVAQERMTLLHDPST
jgi:hypothetical protein